MNADLAACRAVVFDAYGTLFDVHAPAARLERDLGVSLADVSALWRSKQLEYTWLRALMGRHADFWQVTGEALDVALAATGTKVAGLRDRLLALYRTLDAYDDAPAALDQLRMAGLQTAIFSNGTPAMLADAVSAAGLAGRLDAVLSVEEAGIYKPSPRAYQVVVDRLGLPAGAIAFVSSNGFDVHGAAVFGLRAIWLNRLGRPAERLPGTPSATVTSLNDLAGLLRPALNEGLP